MRRVHLVAFLALLPCIAPCTGSAQATRSGRQTSVPAASIADAPLTGNGTPGSHLACPTASGSVSGCLGASDWTTFNSKQPGPLTGDVTTSGAAATLAASGVSANTYGSASQHAQVTFDAKGRATSAVNVTPSLPASAITSGTFADSLLASAYSGVGACGANTWASTLSRNAAPTCTQPAFSNISGTAATGQIPSLDTSKITTGTFADAFLASAYGGVGTCTNQFVSVTSRNAAPTCTTSTLAGPQHANQGTTTTVLHGNGAGNPSWAAVSLTADVSGTLPIGNGGTGATTTSQNFAFVGPTSGSGAPSFRALATGDIPGLDASKITSGTLPQTLGGTGSGSLTCAANQHLTSSGSTYSCTTDTGGTGGTVPNGGLEGQFLYRHPYTGSTTDWGLFSLERREGRAYAKLDGTTSFAIIGALSSPTTSGSSIGYQAPLFGLTRPWIIFNTAATTGSTAGLIGSANDSSTVLRPVARAKFEVNAASLANTRVWFALTSADVRSTAPPTSTPSANATKIIAWAFDSAVSANWLLVSGDGTNWSSVDSGVVANAGGAYDVANFALFLTDDPSNLLTGFISNHAATPTTKSSNLPDQTSHAFLKLQLTITTLANTTTALYVSGYGVEQD